MGRLRRIGPLAFGSILALLFASISLLAYASQLVFPRLPGSTMSVDVDQNLIDVDADVHSMAMGSDGRIYLGTSYQGYFIIYDPSNGTFTNKRQVLPGGTIIYALASSPDGSIYGGTNNAAYLFRYLPASDSFEFPGQVLPGERDLRSLVSAADGTIYGGTGPNAHLIRYKPGIDATPIDVGVPMLGEESVSALTAGQDGMIYGGTSPSGVLFSVNPENNAITVLDTFNVGINALASSQGKVFAGTADDRLISFSYTSGREDLGQIVPGQTGILSLGATSDGKIFGGTAFRGAYVFEYDPLGRYATSVMKVTKASSSESSIAALVVAGSGSVYVGTGPHGRLLKITSVTPQATPTVPGPTPTVGNLPFRVYFPHVSNGYNGTW